MPRSTEDLHKEIEQYRQQVNQRLDAMHTRVEVIAKSQDRIMDLMQGDEALSRKGFIKQVIELIAFMEKYKDFDLKGMMDMMNLITNIKKSLLWVGGFVIALAGLLATIIKIYDSMKEHLPK